MSYNSPIRIIEGELTTKIEDDIMTVVQSYGIDVDKVELARALRYDREQYEKGFDDGRKKQWIPCNARMPEEREWLGTKRFGTTISDEVYVTFENPKGERFCKHLSFQNGKLSRFDESTIDAFYPEAKPIAWMPLPKPWRGE